MNQTGSCPLCNLENAAIIPKEPAAATMYIRCNRCGDYITTLEVQTFPGNLGERRYLLSAVARENKELGMEPPFITTKNTDEVLAGRIPSTMPERLNRLLAWIARRVKSPGEELQIEPHLDYPVPYCRDTKEFQMYFTTLVERNLIKRGSKDVGWTPTYTGWEQLEKSPFLADRTQGFAAMWFADEMLPAFLKGIEPAMNACGYTARRVDRVEQNNKVDDFIISEIRISRFLVADVTGSRGGVYFEAGFAFGLGIPVIWTCRADRKDEDMHFDTRQYPHILWNDPKELKEKLENRIGAIIGKRGK